MAAAVSVQSKLGAKVSSTTALSSILRSTSRSRSRSGVNVGLGRRLRRSARNRSPSSGSEYSSARQTRENGGGTEYLPAEGTLLAESGEVAALDVDGREVRCETEAASSTSSGLKCDDSNLRRCAPDRNMSTETTTNSTTCGWFCGDVAVFRGLKSRADLNGKTGTIVKVVVRETGSERCVVEVPSVSAAMSVKPENLERPTQKTSGSDSNPTSIKDPRKNSVFAANFDKLREKVRKDDAARETRKGRSCRTGSTPTEDPDAVLHQPLTFVVAAEKALDASRRVVIVDPLNRGKGDGMSDDENYTPGAIRPPRAPLWSRPPGETAMRLLQIDGMQPASAERAQTSPSLQLAADSSQLKGQTASATAPGFGATPRDHQGNLTLAVSDQAQMEDRVSEKRSGIQGLKKTMLAKLTQQLQVCLARVQVPDLNDESREKYQDMITSVKAQMAKITGIS